MHAHTYVRMLQQKLADPGATGCRYGLSQRLCWTQATECSGVYAAKAGRLDCRTAEELGGRALVSEILCTSLAGAAALAAASRCMQHFSSVYTEFELRKRMSDAHESRCMRGKQVLVQK